MPRYIDADVLCNVLKKSAADEWNKRALAGTWSYAYQDMIDTIENEPSADVELVRHGRWIECDYKKLEHGFLETYPKAGLCCSVCRARFEKKKMTYKQYCPNCGSRMNGGADDEQV